jgi:DNA-binding PadR family transcriptional regulator
MVMQSRGLPPSGMEKHNYQDHDIAAQRRRPGLAVSSKGTSVKTLVEAEEEGFISIRGEFQKRQYRLTERGAEYVERDKRRLEARRM